MILNIRGTNVLIDDEDYEKVKDFPWSIGNGYALYYKNRKTPVPMHRVILGYGSEAVDHVNGNKLDNRRCNIRLCSFQDNAYNKGKNRNGRHSKYKGVYCTFSGPSLWAATIKHNYESIYLYTSPKEEDCAFAYDVAARILARDFARLNNPANVTDKTGIEAAVKLRLSKHKIVVDRSV